MCLRKNKSSGANTLLGAFSPLLSGPVKQPPQSRLPFQLGRVFSASCPACTSPKPSISRDSWSCTEVDVSPVFSVLFLHLQSIWFCSESRRKGRGIRVVYVCSVACFQYAKTLGSQQKSWLLHVWLVVCCGEEPCRLCMKKSSATETQPACILPFCLAAVSCHPLELSQNPSQIADP